MRQGLLGGSAHAHAHYLKEKLDFSFAPRCRWELRSSGLLHTV